MTVSWRLITFSSTDVEYPPLKTEHVAYWFLRLNGCLTIPNFILHPDRRGAQRTDADIVAVRFPYREELSETERPLVDHPLFAKSPYVDLVVAEVKSARDYCQINGPWTNPAKGNLTYLLHAMGVFPRERVDDVVRRLYDGYTYSDDVHRVRLFAFGAAANKELHRSIIQLTWELDVLPFIFKRFNEHQSQKMQNDQWDETGRELFRSAFRFHAVGEFVSEVMRRLT